jgi:hypothetical protein
LPHIVAAEVCRRKDFDRSHAYLERCFPTVGRFVRTEVLEPVEAEPGLVLWRYRYELQDGGRFSNVEEIAVQGDRIAGIRVYFGGPVN